ncbi:fimbrillin family protein [Bacteroides sp.]
MKRIERLCRTAMLLSLFALAAACTCDDELFGTDDSGTTFHTPLTITVTDGAYTSTEPSGKPEGGGANATRAVENGYATEFTHGDRIGLYVVTVDAEGTRHLNRKNLCLTYDGTSWTPPTDAELTYKPPVGGKILYFAYYPYKDNLGDDDKVFEIDDFNDAMSNAERAESFFSPLLRYWKTEEDQSTYASYAASDLMVAQGEIGTNTDSDGSSLHFTMQHQMALSIFIVPSTTCTYTETIDGTTYDKSYSLYVGGMSKFWRESVNTGRYISNPRMNNNDYSGYYYDSTFKKHEFSVSYNQQIGTYKRYIVNSGQMETQSRPLQLGDFYMKDGGIVPGDAQLLYGEQLFDGIKGDCIGVVFWVGDKLDGSNNSCHWTVAGFKRGDYLLMRDHPECTHAMVVALRDASPDKKIWSSNPESIYDALINYTGFTPEEQETRDCARESDSNFGYTCSGRFYLYRKYHEDVTTDAYDAVEAYAQTNPTPANSSGWFFPGAYELLMMSTGTVDVATGIGDSKTILNQQFDKVGGDKFKADYYWSITEFFANVRCVDFNDNRTYPRPKENSYYSRAVLAF